MALCDSSHESYHIYILLIITGMTVRWSLDSSAECVHHIIVRSHVIQRRHGEILLAESIKSSLDGHRAYIFHYSVAWILNQVAKRLHI